MIAIYNQVGLGDVLMLVLGPNPEREDIQKKGDVVRIADRESGKLSGFNLFNVEDKLGLADEKGQVNLSADQVAKINEMIKAAGFNDTLEVPKPKLTIGYVEEVSEHPDSDHLHVTKTRVDADHTLQIVSGSPNMREGIKVVVAQPGAMMPSGEIIWDGELRGVPSAGMIVSGRELHLPGAPDRPGALVLPDDFGEVGDAFDFDKAQNLYRDGLIDTNY